MNPQLKKLLYIIVIIISLILVKNLIKNYRHLGIKYDRFIENIARGKISEKLVAKNIKKKCHDPAMLEDFIAQEGFNYEEENKKAVSDSLKKLYDSNIKPADHLKVPAITHRMYFSNEEKPVPLNIFYLELLKANYSRLNSTSEEWTHYIWTNMPELFPEEIKNIKGVQVKTLEQFKDHKLYDTLITTIEKGKQLRGRYSEASDVLRFTAIQQLGGFYSDMDYELYHPEILLDYMKKFDFVGARDDNSYYASQFIAAKPNHPILNKAVDLMYRNHVLKDQAPDTVKYPCTPYNAIYFNAPPLFTVAYFSANNKDGNDDIILPAWMTLNLNFARYKNKTCKYSEITEEKFMATENNLVQIMQDFTQDLSIKDNTSIKEFKDYHNNIYYSTKYRGNLKIIGADMGCGTWASERQGSSYSFYWNPIKEWKILK